jgi:hypothetical protein
MMDYGVNTIEISRPLYHIGLHAVRCTRFTGLLHPTLGTSASEADGSVFLARCRQLAASMHNAHEGRRFPAGHP